MWSTRWVAFVQRFRCVLALLFWENRLTCGASQHEEDDEGWIRKLHAASPPFEMLSVRIDFVVCDKRVN